LFEAEAVALVSVFLARLKIVEFGFQPRNDVDAYNYVGNFKKNICYAV
jgi:hypothetical protein